MRTVLTIIACVVLGALGIGPAWASHDDYLYPADDWQVREIGADLVWHPASESEIVDASTLNLTKPSGDIGTSAETTDLGLEGDAVTVDVILNPDATADAGAIRLFAYDHPDGDTLGEAPQAVAIAAGSGPLSLDVSAFAGPIGTLGLVYDASNASAGTVTFKNLQVDGETISFTAHVEPQPEPEPEPEPSDEPDPIAVPTSVPAGVNDGADRGLPLGTAIAIIIVFAGGTVFILSRGLRR